MASLKGPGEFGDGALLDQLTGLLSETRFSRWLELSDVLWSNIQNAMNQCEPYWGVSSNMDQGALTPGYFVVMKHSTKPAISAQFLCVVNGSLCFTGAGDSLAEAQPLPDTVEYLLFRLDRSSGRSDWKDVAELDEAWRNVMAAFRAGGSAWGSLRVSAKAGRLQQCLLGSSR